jgi:hypothetical protein
LFPDGRLPSPRWRPVAIVAVVSFAALTLVSLLSAGRYSEAFDRVSSPLPELSEAVVGLPFAVSGLGALAALVASALALRTRMRRASLVERLQLKCLAYAAMLVPAAVVVVLLENAIAGGEGPATVIATTLALIAIPVAIGVAVMRYRLYEIDPLINRTLVYVTLSAGLAATFAAVSLTLGMVIGSGSTLPTAAGTLAAALVFGPLRPRVQILVDRRILSQHVESAGAVGLVSRGGFGYLLKDRVLDVAEFLEAAERVSRGGSALARRSSRRSSGARPTPSRRSLRASARCSR